MSFKAFVWAWDQDVPNGDHLMVLLALANIAPMRKVRASVPYIAKMSRKSVRKVRVAIAWLSGAELITVEPRLGRTDMITIHVPKNFMVTMDDDDDDDDREVGVRGRPRKNPCQNEQTPAKPLQNPLHRGSDEPIEPLEPNNCLLLSARDPFEEWWSAYPLKKAKVDARKAWAQMSRQLNALTIAELMIKTRAYADHVVGFEPRHILHGATYLRGERWNDELTNRSQTDGTTSRYPTAIDRAEQRADSRLQAMVDGARQASAPRRRLWDV